MILKKFKEKDKKKIGIIVFTITCIMLITVGILYRTFAIFETNDNFNVIEGEVQGIGDVEFVFYVDGNISKNAPNKEEGYSLDTSTSKCTDMTTGSQISTVNWDNERWEVKIQGISKTKTKCYLYFKKIYQEETLNGAIPDLMNGRLVPIKILDDAKPSDVNYDGEGGGKVVKADITQDWYNYTNKQWANAVILRDGAVDNYKPGQEIKESDIESYFVWIPRYRYQLKNNETEYNKYINGTNLETQTTVTNFYSAIGGNKGETETFDIVFETKDKGNIQGSKQGEYLTHPAFVSFDSNGLWVGKFETGYNQNSENTNVMPTESWSLEGAQKNEENFSKIIIKPNVYSWRYIQPANAFYTSYNYQRDLESHMMKNMEWGAVAYLTQSIYGRCTKKEGKTICEEVRINNSESYITGMSATFEPTCGLIETKESCNWYEKTALTVNGEKIQSYYNNTNQEASTTGNYSGIYDMSGDANEYVMGVMQAKSNEAIPASGRDSQINSGFNGPYSNENGNKSDGKPWPSSKYYDLYDYDTSDQHLYRGKLGDGTKEFGPFYSVSYQNSSGGVGVTRSVGSYNADTGYFVNYRYPWIVRGGNYTYGAEAGLASVDGNSSLESVYNSFRIVLAT